MSCGGNCNRCNDNNEVLINNVTYSYNLQEVNNDVYDLVVTPCNVPTSIYCVARISKRENCCGNMEYYQSFINTDPVGIIQDCNLCDIIARSIENYFNNIFNNNSCSCNSNRMFGLF